MIDEPARPDGTGGRRPTMADVARAAGVSRALVSLVFRNKPGAGEETRQRVLQAADRLGYRPDTAARMLASHRSRTLGVMLTVHQPFQADLVEAIYPEAERLGYEVLLSATAPSRDEAKAVEALLSHRCEALILLGPRAAADLLDEWGRRAVVTAINAREESTRIDNVRTADEAGVQQAVDHLVDLGHREIVHVDGGDEPGSAERRAAYRKAMDARGLGERARVLAGAHTEQAGQDSARRLLDEAEPPTAVLASNDRCALGVLRAFALAGVDVPERVSLVGYDDSHVSHLASVALTTIRQDAEQMAQHAVRLAVERLDDPARAPREVVLDPKLVSRGSTAPPR
ncbi:LacI family DNA-binding transcriptional regulator [Saccharopolyspora sp. TS4A08]|uniref:LacI family DNA-binding transcriptional regulator n=1 Tax=Saccharopolyspora ipomoeae TaxID=3042027 RepID=A0ABT6PQK5_9PSEU|nr:LacI family DNA-binding transcriptional regulator [Saccharopolyspora sp. TS4A08]MDI2030291.1 LacI family DNA-binding transcriptional regulator [Saccharopolyspora sp. TS4A08]